MFLQGLLRARARPVRRGKKLLAALAAGLLVQSGCERKETSSAETTETSALNSPAQLAPETTLEHSQADAGRQSVTGHALKHYELEMAPADAEAIGNDAFSNNTHPATFKAEGKTYPGVKVRVRGAWSRSWPKKSLKILFDHGRPFELHRSLNLNSGWRDPAFVREPLAYHVYAVCGAPASVTEMVRLDINGKFAGLFVQVEQPEKEFLKRAGLAGATVYKAGLHGSDDADERDLGSEEAYKACYSKETHKTEGFSDLQQFCHELATATDVVDFFEHRVDLEHYINYLAATVLIQHWDGYNKNHFLVYDAQGSHKWLVVPWDLDRTFGDHWNWSFHETRLPLLLGTRQLPGITGWNRLEDRFFAEPTLRARFLNRLAELLNTEFTEEKLFPVLEQLEAEITPDARTDRRRWPGANSDFHSGIKQVKVFIKERRSFLQAELARLRRTEPKPQASTR